MSDNALHGKNMQMWCDTCGTLILGRGCSMGHDCRTFEINNPGDIRPAMGIAIDTVLALFERHFGTTVPLDGSMMFLNKVAGDDRSDEIVAHGQVIGVMRYNLMSKDFDLELRQPGAELFNEHAKKNIVSFGQMSGHLKGKSVPGGNITDIVGEFKENDPVILRKGNKVGPGTALGSNNEMKAMDKAVRIKDLMTPSEAPLSPKSGRKEFVNANKGHLNAIGKIAASDIRSFVKNDDITVSFSGGKDSLAALAVTMDVTTPELIFVNTGIEFPETVEYVHRFANEHSLKLHVADAGDAFWNNVGVFGPPAKDFRWCCKVCKLGPITDLISKEFPGGTVTVEGNRGLESFSRAKAGFVSKNPFVPNQTTLNPIRKWSAAEVWGYIWMKGLEYNPLYDEDFERIGCYLCASCLSSEWENTRRIHEDMYDEWNDFLHEYAESLKLPMEYVDYGLWRWKVLPPKMVKLAEGVNIRTDAKQSTSMRMLKGASPCAAGGYSMEAVISIPRKWDFGSIEDSLKTIGNVRYSDEFEIALLKTKNGTAKLFGGGQVSITAKNKENAEMLFERSVKALLRSQMCTGCGICVKACKRNAIKIRNGFHVNERCTSCGSCERSCMVMHYYDKMM